MPDLEEMTLQGLIPGERRWLASNDGAGGTLAAMDSYRETLARRIVADVARATSERPQGWVMLHEVARHLKVDEASAEAAMRIAIAWGWLDAEGCSLFRVCLTDAGRAMPLPKCT